MGDRANVHITDGSFVDLYLYTHWSGTELPETVQRAMWRGKERWNDSSYLARIIFCEMVSGAEKELTGYGISSQVGDGEDRIIEVDVPGQQVSIGKRKFTFEEFVKAKDGQIAWRD